MCAGDDSAAKTGTIFNQRAETKVARLEFSNGSPTAAFAPTPMPRRIRHASNWRQFCVNADPAAEKKLKKAAIKIAPRLPYTYSFKGSLSHTPLRTIQPVYGMKRW